MMGAAGALAGATPQPEYTTPPPQYNAAFWDSWLAGKPVDGNNRPITPPPAPGSTSSGASSIPGASTSGVENIRPPGQPKGVYYNGPEDRR
jgi:hypothetical protein